MPADYLYSNGDLALLHVRHTFAPAGAAASGAVGVDRGARRRDGGMEIVGNVG